jgi:hypothetical protein
MQLRYRLERDGLEGGHSAMGSGWISTSLVAIVIGLVAAPVMAGVREGVDAWQAGDYAKAISEWRGPAQAGDADAQFNLAQAYKLGRGVTVDAAVAQGWYEKAALQGHQQAQANLGLILFQNGDRMAALPWLRLASDRGEPRAQYVYATALFNGDIVPKDWPRAYALMSRASAQGLPQAAASLQQMEQYIPIGDRQKGLALAKELEKGGALAGVPVRPATPPKPAPAKPAPPKLAAAKPAAQAQAPATVAAAAGGAWQVQLGAFGSAAAAKSAWGRLASKAPLSALKPSYIAAGAVTRLRAGGLSGRDAANKACAVARAAGADCFPVAP